MNPTEISTNHNKIKRIIITAFFVRLLMLFVVFYFQDYMEDGFIGSSTYYDDYRYELGAENYAVNAKSLIDVSAFVQVYAEVGDWVGYKLATPFDSTPLWYWVACIVIYIFKTKWVLRILNVVISSVAILYVYRFANMVYGEITAFKACRLLAFLPYPVIFSCFSYKDQLVMLIFFYLLSKATQYRYTSKLRLKEIITMAVLTLMLMLTRSGLSIILIFICVIIALIHDFNFLKHISKKDFFLILIAVVFLVVLFVKYGDSIIYKLTYYLARHEKTLTGSTVSFLTINGVFDLYKFPFTYVFSGIMPIDMFSGLGSWYAVVSNLNLIMCPISVGATFYIMMKKTDNIVFWSCFGFYAISIVTSINIFRHYYSLLPLTLIAFSEFSSKGSRKQKLISFMLSLLFIMLLLIFYGFVRGS